MFETVHWFITAAFGLLVAGAAYHFERQTAELRAAISLLARHIPAPAARRETPRPPAFPLPPVPELPLQSRRTRVWTQAIPYLLTKKLGSK